MNVKLSTLNEITIVLLERLEELGFQSINLAHDYYWDIQAPERYDVCTDPGEPTMGQLTDNWSELERMLANPDDIHPYALVRLAAILRYAGEEMIDQEDDGPPAQSWCGRPPGPSYRTLLLREGAVP